MVSSLSDLVAVDLNSTLFTLLHVCVGRNLIPYKFTPSVVLSGLTKVLLACCTQVPNRACTDFSGLFPQHVERPRNTTSQHNFKLWEAPEY